MCYSAMVWADFHSFERLGGKLKIQDFVKWAGWVRRKGNWIKQVPKAMRQALANSDDPELAAIASAAEVEGARAIQADIDFQVERRTKAEAKLASAKPTAKAAEDQRIANDKIKAGEAKLASLGKPASADGIDRIWPGHFAPVMIREPETGEHVVLPMRYRCRLPGWTEAMERQKPGTYNARRDNLTTVWRKLLGSRHGLMVVDRFFESVYLHANQQRALAPGESEQNVEIVFTPEPRQELYVACLWNYTEGEGDDPGFYSFAAITSDPPNEVAIAGHDRCVVAIKPEIVDAWLHPDPKNLNASLAILDDPVDVHYAHELVQPR